MVLTLWVYNVLPRRNALALLAVAEQHPLLLTSRRGCAASSSQLRSLRINPILYLSTCTCTRAWVRHVGDRCDIWPRLLDGILKLDYTTIRSSNGAYTKMSVQK